MFKRAEGAAGWGHDQRAARTRQQVTSAFCQIDLTSSRLGLGGFRIAICHSLLH